VQAWHEREVGRQRGRLSLEGSRQVVQAGMLGKRQEGGAGWRESEESRQGRHEREGGRQAGQA
jgi:hypothetical protein